MRRVLGLALMGLFGFLLVVGLLAQFYAPGQVKKTPLDVNTLTNLAGEGSYLGAAATPVTVWQRTQAIGNKSNSSVVVMRNFSCVMKDPDGTAPHDPVCVADTDPRLISASEDLFATDRKTAMAVNGTQYIGADGVPHQGLVNKFPFDVEKKTYPMWDGLMNGTVDATFAGEEAVNGLNTYKFVIDIQDAQVDIAAGTSGSYSDQKTMWIDPVTGSFINQTEHQVRTLPSGDTVLDLSIAFTDATVQENVDAANTNIGLLNIIGMLPLISYLLAALSLVAGLLLLRGTTRRVAGARDADLDALIDSGRS